MVQAIDGAVAYGAHQWDSVTFSSVAQKIAEERRGLMNSPDDPPPAIEPGWVEGSQRGDGWLPLPSSTGKGWGWVGATAADYNRYFRQSVNDPATIQGAVGAWSYLNGTPKLLDLVGFSLNQAIQFSADHPGVACVLRGFHTLGTWQTSHGGDGSITPRAAIIRDGTTVSLPPQPFHGTSTGFFVIGGLAVAAGALAAVSAIGATAGAGSAAATTTTSVADVADVTVEAPAALGGESSGIFSTLSGVAGNATGVVSAATGALGAVKTIDQVLGGGKAGGTSNASAVVADAGASGQASSSSALPLIAVAAALLLVVIVAARG